MGSNSYMSHNNNSISVFTWKGVQCDAKGENVIGLKASGLGLTGLIPDSTIGKLTKLRFLDLSNNKITALPSDLWCLGSLKRLNLSCNKITGSLSNNIGNFGRLQVVDLSDNDFSGEIPETISSLVSLQTLKLAGNGFEGSIPTGILRCWSLVSLDLSSNRLNGTLPDGLTAAFPKLKYLNLARNEIYGNLFQGDIHQVNFNWSHLVYLDLSENRLSGEIFVNLSQALNLRHLNLAYNRLARQKFPRIGMLSSLEYLNLSKTSLVGHIPSEISELSYLHTLDVSSNNLSGEIPVPVLQKLPLMKRFNFSYNNLTLCASGFSLDTFETAFYGSLNSCPIAANPVLFKRRAHIHKVFTLNLALALTLVMVCLLAGLLFLAFNCRKKSRTWLVKQPSYKEEQNMSGPFSFQTDSTTWVADVKHATSVPVMMFEKPLLNITFADLLSATSNFSISTLVSEGKFGPVYRGFLPGGIYVAVKILVHGSTLTDHEVARELEYLGRIKHPNLVPLIGYCLAGDQRIAIYDHMENGNLQDLLHDTWEEDSEGLSTLTWRFRHKIALGIARALAFLHHGCSPPLVHKDVKASSVYLDLNLEPRLSDFGLAKLFGTSLEDDEISGRSPAYVPPEFSQLESDDAPTPKSDVYCFGVVFFELITGKKPIGDDYPEEQEANLVSWVRGLVRKNQGSKAIDPKIRDTGPVYQMEEALKIAYLCTAELPTKRPSMQQIVGLLKDIEPTASQ
ncbi:putative LRR receptor-like serine/threonine-protein kinase [Gossypium australe]|uniref:Putative LRR receptor-like serine/threonine-protein kinase n=1 Tax=Gossypium australe TaxID=47621 RepID=A0A5B6WZ88_9ROSI|nr:putative LRR receptor-like serine/threonine-protein kinase [Gossypium australe]